MFRTLFEKVDPIQPLRPNRCRKLSYIDPLLMRFSSKSGQNICIHTFRGPFLENPVFDSRPSEAIFDLERRENGFLDSENGFLDLENWFLECGILKYWNLEHPNWHLGGFQEPFRARGRPPGAK